MCPAVRGSPARAVPTRLMRRDGPCPSLASPVRTVESVRNLAKRNFRVFFRLIASLAAVPRMPSRDQS